MRSCAVSFSPYIISLAKRKERQGYDEGQEMHNVVYEASLIEARGAQYKRRVVPATIQKFELYLVIAPLFASREYCKLGYFNHQSVDFRA